MKKFLCVMLVFAMLCVLTACGGNDEVTYDTLEDLLSAVESAESGAVLTLGADIYLPNESTSQIVVKKDLTINGNNHKIWCDVPEEGYAFIAPIAVREDATLTINDLKIESTFYCVNVGKLSEESTGHLVINSGNFKGDTTAVQVQLGDVTINGGYFEVVPYNDSYKYTINMLDSAYRDNKATAVVKGGTFFNYDPSQSAGENPVANFVAQGYTVTSAESGENTLYTVSQAQAD